MNFKIDERATIGSVLKALQTEGIKTSDVAKAIEGISEKPLRNALKQAGYIFQNKAPKGWHYVAEGEEPLNKSIFDYVNSSNTSVNSHKVINSNTKVKDSSREVITSNTEIISDSSIVHPQFTKEEISDLMSMLYEWRNNKNVVPEVIEENLHNRIKQLPKNEKTRKTIVIDKSIGERLDEFCEAENFNKSDILHLALLDFLNRH